MNKSASKSGSEIEVEQKYHVGDVSELERQLSRLGAKEEAVEQHRDTYYRHPARDFAQTREALRIRRVVLQRQRQEENNRQVAVSSTLTSTADAADSAAAGEGSDEAATLVTYKGPYEHGGVKARPELEWRIDPCDPDGTNLARLLGHLGLSEILTVRKTRRSFSIVEQGKQLTITIDDTSELGMFAEVETIASGPQEREECGTLVTAIAKQLGLRDVEKRSYLQMALEAAQTR
jgi:adenylate cyclase, class 2